MEELLRQFQQGGGAGGSGFQQPQPEVLLEFKAGKLNEKKISSSSEEEERLQIEPDLRKGKIVLEKGVDNAIHFKWIDRYTNRAEVDLLLFPNDQIFERIKANNEKDRCYILKFLTNKNRRFFYWLQDLENDKDEENVKKLNEFMNNPAAASSSSATTNPTDATANNTNPNEFMTFMQGLEANPNTNDAATGGIQLNDVANAFSGINQNASSSSSTGLTQNDLQSALANVAQAMQSNNAARAPGLEEIVKSQDVSPLLEDEAIVEALLPLLPEELRSKEELQHTLSSPQLRQALVALSSALQSGNFNVIMGSFGLDPNLGAEEMNRGDGIGAFLAAIQKEQDNLKKNDDNKMDTDEKKDEKKKDDEEDNFYD